MPDSAALTEMGLAHLAQLPPALRDSDDYMAVIHAIAKELEALEAAIETVRRQFIPTTADVLLSAWEYEVKLPIGGPVGATVASRRAAVIGRLQKPLTGEGRDWERAITALVGAGWTYQEHDPADPTSPVDGVVRITIPWASGTPQFTDVSNQIRDITDAHLEIDLQSSAPFLLDSSDMDVQEFGQ